MLGFGHQDNLKASPRHVQLSVANRTFKVSMRAMGYAASDVRTQAEERSDTTAQTAELTGVLVFCFFKSQLQMSSSDEFSRR